MSMRSLYQSNRRFQSIDRFVDNNISSTKQYVEKTILNVIDSLKIKIKSRYGFTVEITNAFAIKRFNDWLAGGIDKKYSKRPISDNKLLADTSFAINVDENTFIFCIVGNSIFSDTKIKAMNINRRDDNDTDSSNFIKLFIYGLHAKKYFKYIKEEILTQSIKDLVIYNISSNGTDKYRQESFQSIISALNPRDINTLFYDDGVKEEIINHIDSFFANKNIYEKRNINFKTSILLYGEPGTGKSSLANALCQKYNLNMVLVDMNTFDTLDVTTLTKCLDGDDNTYIVVLEDIDTIFSLNRKDENNDTKLEKDDKKVINKLLQFLDSNNSPSNVIFIATTNHPEKLDAALTRKGRIDKRVYVGPINKNIARSMCKSFDLDDEKIDKILSKYENTINQSSLQGDILDALKGQFYDQDPSNLSSKGDFFGILGKPYLTDSFTARFIHHPSDNDNDKKDEEDITEEKDIEDKEKDINENEKSSTKKKTPTKKLSTSSKKKSSSNIKKTNELPVIEEFGIKED